MVVESCCKVDSESYLLDVVVVCWVHGKDDDIGEDAARRSAVRSYMAQALVASSVGYTVREVVASCLLVLGGKLLSFWVCVFCETRSFFQGVFM